MAVRADPEHLQAVGIDREAGRRLDPLQDGPQAQLADLDRSAARGAHHMVVMGVGRARDVGVLSGWEVDALDEVEVGEELQGAKDRGAANGPPPRARGGEDILGGEMPILVRDRLSDGTASHSQALAGAAQCGEETIGLGHRAGGYAS